MTAAEYFRETNGFERFLTMCRNKYVSLSRIGGKIELKDASEEEKKAIGGLLGTVFDGNDICVSLIKTDKALKSSRFGIGLKELLEEYFKEEIITRTERNELIEKERNEFFAELQTEYSAGKSAEWIRFMLSEKKVFTKRYNEDRSHLKQDVDIVCRALDNLGKPELLPVFSSRVSGDPHALDSGTSCGQLFNYALEYITGGRETKNAAQRMLLLESVQLYSDMVSSYVYCKNIRLYDDIGEHPAYAAFAERDETFTLNIGSLMNCTRAEANNNTVYIVENPAVFTSLAQRTNGVSLICIAGQPKGAGISLLRLLKGCIMYYSGDFDMGGIRIADRLLSEFPEIRLWRYSENDYRAALSHKGISAGASDTLCRVKSEALKPIAMEIAQNGHAGYQENILDRLTSDVTRNL